ncbi:BGTF surface domain-containing protein [Halorubellus salinus]|uniref:BGTF surface domain-containing protein n=1 Tax=Halorubellus salinus TaxID=755309 RepID=UPI001D082627|nr:BGTF surface domain-containing protein [Halorubellus salinus]
MTDENNKLRALVLTALMVFSVFAGTVALSGAAAANLNTISGASATTVSANADDTQTVEFDVTIDGNTEEQVDIQYSSLSDVNVQSVDSASSSNSSAVEITNSQTNSGDAQITVKDVTGDGTHTVTITVMTTVSTGAASTGNSLTIAAASGPSDTTTFKVGAKSTDYDRELDEGNRYWSGQVVWNDTFDSNDQGVELQRQTSTGFEFVTEVDVDANGEVVLDTSGYETGTYLLTDTSQSPADADQNITFKLSSQDYSASADPTTVKNGGDSTNTDITVTSNRNSYSHWISSPDLTAEELNASLGNVGVAYADTDGDGENDYVAVPGTTSDTLTANFTDVSTGNYTINFLVPDTGVTSSVDITVEGAQTGSADFVTKAVSEERGDIVAMNVSFTGTASTAQVTFGGPSVNYEESVTVTDGNDDGYVTVYWNTYLAGTNDASTFSVASEDDSIESTTLSSQFATAGPGTLSGGEYPVNASLGSGETGVATVVLNNPNDVQRSINVWTAPSAADSLDSESPSYVFDAITQDDTVAVQDGLVLEVTAAGIYGELGTPAAAFADGAAFKNVGGADLTITQTNPGTNLAPTTINASNRTVLVTPGSNSWLLYADTAEGNFSAGENYRANVSFSPNWAYGTKSTQSATASFSVVERSALIDAPQDTSENPLIVEQSSEAEISGTSSLAAGTNLTVTARSSGGQNPFLRSTTATVQDDGTWTTSIDVSDIPTGTNFTVSVKDGSRSGETVNARIGGASNIQLASLDAPETAAPGSTITVTATVENTGDSSGETEVAFVFENETLLTQNVTVDAGSTTQVTFEPTLPSETGDYTHGVQVGDNDVVTAGITVQEDTTTTEPTTTEPTDEPTTTEPTDEPTTTEPTDEPTTAEPTDEETTTDSSGGSPGFGVAVALVALVAAALLATRRD